MSKVSKNKYSDAERSQVEDVVAHLCHAVTEYDVMRWLDNFEDKDRLNALTILKFLDYYTVNQIYALIKRSLKEINMHHHKKVYVVPVRALGKSGSLMAYYVRKTVKDNQRYVISSANDLANIRIGNKDVLCLVDDFSGSGKTIKDFYAEHNENFARFTYKYAILLAYMPKAEGVMKSVRIKALGDEHESIFERRNSVFGSEKRMKELRDFAYKYGKRLYPSNKKRSNALRPLGYANSKALIAFDYTTPNNTLPIIWADKFVGNSRCWHPLFPRFAIDFVNRLGDERRDYWLRLHTTNGLESPFVMIDDDGVYEVDKVKMYKLLELIHRGSRVNMRRRLGVSGIELEEIKKKAHQYGYLDEHEYLTPTANAFLDEIERAQKIASRQSEDFDMDNEVYTYVPKRFMGDS